jgi:hypothetical protein
VDSKEDATTASQEAHMSFEKKRVLSGMWRSNVEGGKGVLFFFRIVCAGQSVEVAITTRGHMIATEVVSKKETCFTCRPREMLKHRAIVKEVARTFFGKGLTTNIAVKELFSLLTRLQGQYEALEMAKTLLSVKSLAARKIEEMLAMEERQTQPKKPEHMN